MRSVPDIPSVRWVPFIRVLGQCVLLMIILVRGSFLSSGVRLAQIPQCLSWYEVSAFSPELGRRHFPGNPSSIRSVLFSE